MTLALDLASLKALYAEGRTTPRDVVREVYRRIAKKGADPDWISLLPEREALTRCAHLPKGALYGVPFAVKDNIDVADLPTTCACPEFSYIPRRSATVVERLEAEGAIVIGKTNLDQFATGLVGTRSPYGIPRNVFNSEYVAGGSSSGSAVAVAAGLVSFALGTDTAGSGRVPAGFNNIVGLKPTKGTLSARGVVPACRTLDTISIFALTVADASAVSAIATAYDKSDSFARPPLSRVSRFPSRPRVGIPKQPLEFFGDAASAELFSAAIERARGLGSDIIEIDFAPFQKTAALLYQGPWVAERLAAVKDFVAENPGALHEVVRGIIVSAARYTAVDVFEGQYTLAGLARAAEAEWRKMDMLLLPTAPTIYKVDDVLADPVRLNSNLGLYTNFVNLLDLSAIAVPAGMRGDGLPFGVTLIARAGDDVALAGFGDPLHRALSGARLGATGFDLASTPPVDVGRAEADAIHVAVVGAHLSGQPLNTQLVERQAKLVQTARTAPGYSFYALADSTPAKPGLLFDGQGAGSIEVEIWEMDAKAFGSFVALIPPPLGIGNVALDDGSVVKGFLCEPHAVKGATDITRFGGWRAWLASHKTA